MVLLKENVLLKSNILLLIGCFLIASCQGDLVNESFINLEDEYELSISQELSSNGGLAALNITTTRELECSNYSIPYQLEVDQDDIKLVISKVSLEGKCLALSSFISQNIDFSFYNAKKNITILLQDFISNSGKISVTDDEISLELSSNDGIKISKAKINRIRKGMMWGSIANGTQSSIDQIKEILTSHDNGTTVKSGDYGLFYVAGSSDLHFYDVEQTPIHSFIIFSDSHLDDIKAQIEDIKENDSELNFKLTLFDGQTISI